LLGATHATGQIAHLLLERTHARFEVVLRHGRKPTAECRTGSPPIRASA
jgi:hypothetical protein